MSDQQWRTWDVQGLQVNSIRFTYQIDFHLLSTDDSQREFLFVLEAPFTLHRADGTKFEMNPGQPEDLYPLLSVLHRPVTSFRASSEGECQMHFHGGDVLTCLPVENYEAWNSHGSGNLASASLLCGPGGGSPWAT